MYIPVQKSWTFWNFMVKNGPFSKGSGTRQKCCHALELLAPNSHRLDFSNEVHSIPELPVVLKIQAVKVERTKSKSV